MSDVGLGRLTTAADQDLAISSGANGVLAHAHDIDISETASAGRHEASS